MKTKHNIFLICKTVFVSFIMLSFLLTYSFAVEESNISPNSGVQDKAENTTSLSQDVIDDIIAKLKEQETLLKSNVVLSYTITIKPSEILLKNIKDAQAGNSNEKHEVTVAISGFRTWEESTRFGIDGKKTLEEAFSWDGKSARRIIISESTGVKKGWKNYNPASRRNNPTSTQNILLIFGFLGTQEHSISEFIANHQKEIKMSQKDSEIFLNFSVLNGSLDYLVVLDSNHSFWPKHVTQIYRNAKEDGVELGDIRFEYSDIEFGQKNVGNSVAFYPKKMKHISFFNSGFLENEEIETPDGLIPMVTDEISITSINFEQNIPDEKFQLDFPDDIDIQ